jgi:hypothetical protein
VVIIVASKSCFLKKARVKYWGFITVYCHTGSVITYIIIMSAISLSLTWKIFTAYRSGFHVVVKRLVQILQQVLRGLTDPIQQNITLLISSTSLHHGYRELLASCCFFCWTMATMDQL